METDTVSNSRLAAMLGMDSRCSQLALYHRMRGEVPDIQDNEAMRQGRYYEEATAKLCCDTRGMQLIQTGAQETVSEGRFSGHRDFAAIDEHGKLVTLEVKNLMFADVDGEENGWGEPETDQVPMAYLLQEMGYIHTHHGKPIVQDPTSDVPDALRDHRFADYGYIAARLRSGVHRFKIQLDPAVIAKLDAEMEAFLENVKNGNPPTPQDEADARNRWAVKDDTWVEADESILETMRLKLAGKEQIKLLAEADKAYNLLILSYAKEKSRIDWNGRTVATLNANRAFDAKACVADHPKILEEYSKLDTTRLKAEQPTLYEIYSKKPESAVDQTRPIKLKKKVLMPAEAK